jgi:hypothetical protein
MRKRKVRETASLKARCLFIKMRRFGYYPGKLIRKYPESLKI